ncbi:MAG: hypothetical protein ACRCYZ_04600 [Alphaproteobacteria bacterium]
MPKKQKQALCAEVLGAPFWGRLVHKRFFHLVSTEEAACSKRSAGVPSIFLEIGSIPPPGSERVLRNPQDFHVMGLLPGMTLETEDIAVVLEPPHVPFAAAFDVILLHGGTPLGETLEFQDWIRMLLGCLKPGGRFYFNTPGSYHCFEHQGDRPSPCAPTASLSTPYSIWFPEPSVAHVFEEWHQVPSAWLDNTNIETRLPSMTFHVVMGSYQKPYDFSEEE